MKDWREESQSQRLKKRVEEIKIAGRPAVAPQRVSASARESLPAVDEDEEEHDHSADAELDLDARVAPGPAVIKFHERERVSAPPPQKEHARTQDRPRQDHLPASLSQLAAGG